MLDPGLVGALLSVAVIGCLAFVAFNRRSLVAAAALTWFMLTIGLIVSYGLKYPPAIVLALAVVWLLTGAYVVRRTVEWLKQNRSSH